MEKTKRYYLVIKILTAIAVIVAACMSYYIIADKAYIDFNINWNMFDSILIWPLFIIGFIVGLGQKFEVYESFTKTEYSDGSSKIEKNNDIIDSTMAGCLMPILNYFVIFPLVVAALIYYTLMGIVYLFAAVFPYFIVAFFILLLIFTYKCNIKAVASRKRHIIIPVLSVLVLFIFFICWLVWTGGANVIPTIVFGSAVLLSLGLFLALILTVREDTEIDYMETQFKENRISRALMISFGILFVLVVGVLCFKGLSSDSDEENYTDSYHCSEPNYIIKTSSSLNVRSGPGNNYKVIGTLNNEDKVVVENISGDWASIYYNGKSAYISSKYIIPVSSISEEEPAVLYNEYEKNNILDMAPVKEQEVKEEYVEEIISDKKKDSKLVVPIDEKPKRKEKEDLSLQKKEQQTVQQNKFPGYIVENFPNGNKYEGNVNGSGLKHGTGTYKWANGDKYVGNWINGQATGKGIYYSREGWRYEGEFLDLKFNGNGIYYFSDGKSRKGVWKNGVLSK